MEKEYEPFGVNAKDVCDLLWQDLVIDQRAKEKKELDEALKSDGSKG